MSFCLAGFEKNKCVCQLLDKVDRELQVTRLREIFSSLCDIPWRVWSYPFKANVSSLCTFNFKNMNMIQATRVSYTHENIWLAVSPVDYKIPLEEQEILAFTKHHLVHHSWNVFIELFTLCRTLREARQVMQKGPQSTFQGFCFWILSECIYCWRGNW